MELKIDKTSDMPLLSRKRVTAWVDYTGKTPSRLELQKQIAKKISSKEDLVIVKHIYPRYGQQHAKVIANIYTNIDDLKRFEHDYLIKKNSPAEKKEEANAA